MKFGDALTTMKIGFGHGAFFFNRFYGKGSFSVTTPCPRPTRVNTERLAERETLLYRLGSPFALRLRAVARALCARL
jgi:hypothetical protein